MTEVLEHNGTRYGLVAQRPTTGLKLYSKLDTFNDGPILLGTAPSWAPMEVEAWAAHWRFANQDGWQDADGQPIEAEAQPLGLAAQTRDGVYIGVERANNLTPQDQQLLASALNARIAQVGQAPLASAGNLAVYGLDFALDALERLAKDATVHSAARLQRLAGRLEGWPHG